MITDIFQQPLLLENERVLLRSLEETDVENLLPLSLQEPEIWKFGIVTAAGDENLRNYINNAVKSRNEQKEYSFIVFDKKNECLYGQYPVL
jgi:hypothetical protein